MKIGVPAEVKNNEFRVAITPAGVHELARAGHEVFVEAGAGEGSSLPDDVFAAVKKHFDARTITELTATIAAYNLVSRFLEALQIDPEKT